MAGTISPVPGHGAIACLLSFVHHGPHLLAENVENLKIGVERGLFTAH